MGVLLATVDDVKDGISFLFTKFFIKYRENTG